MKIYADPITVNCRKVLAGLDLIGIPYQHVHVDYFTAQQQAPEFVAINPNAALPAMVDDDFILWESNAILQYAADKAGNTSVYPTDLRVRADINRWLLWESSAWFPSCYVYLVENCVKPLLKGDPDPAVLEAQNGNFLKLAGILDARLANATWIAGPGPTIADIALAAPMHLHQHQGMPLQAFPNLRRWMIEAVEPLPCWERSFVNSDFTLGRKAA